MIRTIPPANREALEQGLRRLKLRHMREHLDDINELALQEEPSYMDFLGYLVVREVEGRERTQRETRLKSARLPFHRTLDDFDFGFQNSVSRQTLLDLAQLQFIESKENVILLGPPRCREDSSGSSPRYRSHQLGLPCSVHYGSRLGRSALQRIGGWVGFTNREQAATQRSHYP